MTEIKYVDTNSVYFNPGKYITFNRLLLYFTIYFIDIEVRSRHYISHRNIFSALTSFNLVFFLR